ncbi:MAG: hypothetical protein IPO02_01670 [Bacteroidetes bacterium]|nr:hypothetical protein [Bacteroidota bacterium]
MENNSIKKYLIVFVIFIVYSNFIFAQLNTDVLEIRKNIVSTDLHVFITNQNKCYYTNNQDAILNILNIFNSLEGHDVVGHYHPDDNYWIIDFVEIKTNKKIKTLYYNNGWNSFMNYSQHFRMTNDDFENKILLPLQEYDKLIYKCKSLAHYRKSVDELNKKRNRKLYLQNSANKIINTYYYNDNWGFYNFEIKDLDFVNYKTLTDSIQNEIRKSVSNNDINIFFNYPQLIGQISMEEKNAEIQKIDLKIPKIINQYWQGS